MSKKLTHRINKIQGKELDEWFTDHLPYRLDALTTFTRYDLKGIFEFKNVFESVNPIVIKEVENCTIEIATLTCRKFMEFLGLQVRYPSSKPKLVQCRNEYYPANEDRSVSYEVKVSDVNGEFVEISQLSKDQIELLENIYTMANRTTAHITTGSQYQGKIEYLHPAVIFIEYLLKSHLYDVVGKEYPKGKTLCELYNILPTDLDINWVPNTGRITT